MLNKEGYNEFHHQGSARDYFIKNSSGAFRPTFDVIGPITISQTRAYYGGTSDDRRYNMARKALIEALDTLLRWNSIDFSQYDNDKDGNVDFVYMIYAGVGRSSSGVVESIWPHASSITKRMGNGPTVKRTPAPTKLADALTKQTKQQLRQTESARLSTNSATFLASPIYMMLEGTTNKKRLIPGPLWLTADTTARRIRKTYKVAHRLSTPLSKECPSVGWPHPQNSMSKDKCNWTKLTTTSHTASPIPKIQMKCSCSNTEPTKIGTPGNLDPAC